MMSNYEKQAPVYHRASAGVYVVSGVPWEFGTNAAPPCAADWWVSVGSERPFWTPCLHSVMDEVKGQSTEDTAKG